MSQLSQILPILLIGGFLLLVWWYQHRGGSRKPQSFGSLDQMTRDLTARAREGGMDPVTGRDEELDRITHILLRRMKNNPLLLGEPGVGKTAVVEGLAQRIVNGDVPKALEKKSVLALDLTSLISETKYRGDLEQRLQAMMKALEERAEEIVLFIDEIHLIAQMSGAEGSLNVSDVLKPLLARGEIQVIGATTWREFQKYIEPDEAFARRLQPVLIDEPTPERALEILRSLKEVYETFHQVRIDDTALQHAVTEAHKRIDYRYLPDSAIDVIDEACAKVAIEGSVAHHVALGAIHAAASASTEGIVTTKDIDDVIEQWVGREQEHGRKRQKPGA